MLTPVPRQVAVHEIGHAFILLTCGVDDDVALHHVEMYRPGPDRHGEMVYALTALKTDIEDLSLAWTLDGTTSMAMMAIAGHVAERVQGYEADVFASYDDLLDAGMLIACLSGASRKELELARGLYTGVLHIDDVEQLETYKRVQERLSELVEARCGQSLDYLYDMLVYETEQRLSMCEVAVGRLADELVERGRLEADDVREILRKTPWCGVLGSPAITRCFKETWPSEYVLEMLERVR